MNNNWLAISLPSFILFDIKTVVCVELELS